MFRQKVEFSMNFYLANQDWIHESDLDSAIFNSNSTIYEVVRLISGIPLFLEDHFLRLGNSFRIKRLEFDLDFLQFKANITELARRNQVLDGNIKFAYSEHNHIPMYIYGFIPHSYPDSEDYTQGVKTDLLWAERENPNAKIIQHHIREEANQLIKKNELYEVLLVDRNGMITEGSRSNVFFVKGDVFYTAPVFQVLVGITRQKVVDCLKELNYPLIEQAVKVSEINQFDAVFLTGTSPKILPVKSIGDLMFDTRLSIVKKLIEHYDKLITQYILNQKSTETSA